MSDLADWLLEQIAEDERQACIAQVHGMDSSDADATSTQGGHMDTMSISVGDPVLIIDSHGQVHRSMALSGVEREGHNFPVVWVERPLTDGGTERVPWPADSVRPA